MCDEEALRFLEGEINQRISSFKDRIDFYRQGTVRFTMLSACLSAATTILIGVGQIYNWQPLSVIALIISASMTIVNAWDGLFNYRSRWINNNETLMKLYELKSDIEYQQHSQTLQNINIDEFYQRYKVILRYPTQDATQLPVAFLFNPNLLNQVARYFPFDTGAANAGRYGQFSQNLSDFFDDYSVNGNNDFSIMLMNILGHSRQPRSNAN